MDYEFDFFHTTSLHVMYLLVHQQHVLPILMFSKFFGFFVRCKDDDVGNIQTSRTSGTTKLIEEFGLPMVTNHDNDRVSFLIF